MTAIAKKAASLEKSPSKKECFAQLRAFAEKHPEQAQELGDLYRYLMPPRSNKAKEGFEWVARACEPLDDNRVYLTYVYVTDEWLTATDGARLHRLRNTDGLAPGWYNHVGDFIYELDEGNAIHNYPEVDRVIGYNRWEEKSLTVNIKELTVNDPNHLPRYHITTEEGALISVVKVLLDDAVRGQKEFTLKHCGPNDAVHIETGDYLSVVMPFRY